MAERDPHPRPRRFRGHLRRGSTWLAVTVAAAAVTTAVAVVVQRQLSKQSASKSTSVPPATSVPPPTVPPTAEQGGPPATQATTDEPPPPPKKPAPPPIRLEVRNRSAGPWLVTSALSSLPAPPRRRGMPCATSDWVQPLAATNAREMRFDVYATGLSDGPVILDRARPVITRAAQPLAGHVVSCGGEGESLPARRLEVSLNRRRGSLRYVPGADPRQPGSSRAGPRAFRFVLAKNQAEDFQIHAMAQHCYCEWKLKLSYVFNGHRSTAEVADAGKPFALSSDEASPDAFFESGRWREP